MQWNNVAIRIEPYKGVLQLWTLERWQRNEIWQHVERWKLINKLGSVLKKMISIFVLCKKIASHFRRAAVVWHLNLFWIKNDQFKKITENSYANEI